MRTLSAALLGALALAASGCGGDDDDGGGNGLSGRITADGSSTVGPLTSLAAERFREEQPDVRVTVGVSGTGGGFERFCRGETDLSNASRPIDDEERRNCEGRGIEYVEFRVATDAITVVVNSENDWVDCVTTAQLKRIWQPSSKVENWNDVDPSFDDESLTLYGPGTDSGTFDYFTEEIVGEEGASRSDYTATEDDNVIVQGVAGSRGGLGYFGLSYFNENQDTLKALEIDSGEGCIAPSAETAQSGEYEPLARPLFIYAKRSSFEREEVREFLGFILDNNRELAERALYVPLTDEQLQQARGDLDAASG
jgi:phosphate transport system substrate-binding protein